MSRQDHTAPLLPPLPPPSLIIKGTARVRARLRAYEIDSASGDGELTIAGRDRDLVSPPPQFLGDPR